MKILLLCSGAANERALAHRLHAIAPLSAIGVIRIAPQPAPLLRRVVSITLGRPLRHAWAAMLAHFERRAPAFPDVRAEHHDGVNAATVLALVERERPDLVLVSGTDLLQRPLIEAISRTGRIMNLHTGISPYIKGAPNSTNVALARGEFRLIGNTVMWLDEGIDTGDIIATERTPLTGRETLDQLHVAVMEHGHDLYARCLQRLRDGLPLPSVAQADLGPGRLLLSRQWSGRMIVRAVLNFRRGYRPETVTGDQPLRLVSLDPQPPQSGHPRPDRIAGATSRVVGSRRVSGMSDWDRVKDLEVHIDDYVLERLERDVSSDFSRVTTVIRMTGGGEEGIGEDVTYDTEDHDAAQEAGPVLPLTGRWTLATLADHLAATDLFPGKEPEREVSRLYRHYAYESAALDLALRQAGTSLHAFLGREPRPLTYVVSLRLGEPPSLDPVTSRLEHYPSLRFKLDPTPTWTDEIITGLRETGSVDSVDFKGHYKGTIVDNPPEVGLYRRVVEGFPDAWIEDPHLDDDVQAFLEPHRDRVTWDAPIHGIADIEALPYAPKMVNVKPSRVGSLKELFATYAYCDERGIGMYGGGQFELGPGRGQIQLLASIYHPDTPNDVSPAGFHVAHPPAGLPESPLEPQAHERGFRWG